MGLAGESGSGKSVSAQALLGLLPKRVTRVPKGSARFEGQELLGMPEEELRKVRGARIAMIFQDPLSSLNPVLTVGAPDHRGARGAHRHQRQGRDGASRGAAEARRHPGRREACGRPSAPVQRWHAAAGDDRDRTVLRGRASSSRTSPTTALDVTIQAQILDLLQRLRKELGMAVLIITHDLGVVAGFADRLAVMYAGRLAEQGTSTEVLTTPAAPLHRRGCCGR